MRRIPLPAVLIASLSLVVADGASAAMLEPVGSFDQPISVTSDPADPDRLFVAEREGRVVVTEEGESALFGDLESLVTCCSGERGLLSISLAPDFPTSERFYAFYTGTTAAGGTEGDIHIDAFHPGPGGSGELIREQILHIDHDQHPNHHGGQLHFGPDGYLYASVGDGGGTGDPLEEAQELETLNGKILRIDPEPGQAPPYVAPADNPFVGTAGADEIWSYGLRNPWRFSFDRETGDMIVGDVGQKLREEVDFAPSPGPGMVGGKGVNYGWNCREGPIAYEKPAGYCDGVDPSAFTDPVFDYPHDDPGDGGAHGCSITGGYVVRDPNVTDLFGRYVYADFCQGEVRSLTLPGTGGAAATGDRSERLSVSSPVSFGEGSDRRVYVVSRSGGVYRFAPGEPPVPPAGDTPPGAGGEAAPQAQRPPPKRAPRPPRIRLDAEHSGRPAGLLFRLTVRAEPCARFRGATVRLNRGGRRSGAKPLGKGCTAHFHRRVLNRSTFRAFLLVGGRVLRSPRLLVIVAGEAQRSQVRTIALAKPRP